MRRAAALGMVAVVFAVGLAAGVLGGRLLQGTSHQPRSVGPPPFQRYFSRGDLDLTPDQQERMEALFARQRVKFETLHSEMRPRVETLMDETQSEVEAILTPDQLERYRARRDRWHWRSRHREPRRYGPGLEERRRHRQHRDGPPPPTAPPTEPVPPTDPAVD